MLSADAWAQASVTEGHALGFGNVVQGTGTVNVTLTSPNTGWVTLTAPSGRSIGATLTAPASLTDGGGNTIPYTAGAAYNIKAFNPGTASTMPPSGNTCCGVLQANDNGITAQGYIWVYGSINVGMVSAGSYSAVYNITLTVY
ncbi:MAG TPA: hypothetical protein VKA08_08725 [Balneolales bacterium]|nr:hypothetical protein [Balneolales bacterium]